MQEWLVAGLKQWLSHSMTPTLGTTNVSCIDPVFLFLILSLSGILPNWHATVPPFNEKAGFRSPCGTFRFFNQAHNLSISLIFSQACHDVKKKTQGAAELG